MFERNAHTVVKFCNYVLCGKCSFQKAQVISYSLRMRMRVSVCVFHIFPKDVVDADIKTYCGTLNPKRDARCEPAHSKAHTQRSRRESRKRMRDNERLEMRRGHKLRILILHS